MKSVSDANCKSLGTSLFSAIAWEWLFAFKNWQLWIFSTFSLIISGKMALHKRLLYEKVIPWPGWDEDMFLMCC